MAGETAAPSLTARERECLLWVARGRTGREIALLLGISERTVRFHIANACRRLGAERRSEAVALAVDRGLIRL